MRRFAFLVHPRGPEDLSLIEHNLPRAEFERICADWSAFEYEKIAFGEVEGSVVTVPLTAAQMEALPRPFARAKVLEAARLATELGAEVVGLGAMTSVVTRSGRWLSGQVPALISNGNAFTAAVVAGQVRGAIGDELSSQRVAIVGAGGSVGLGCAKLLAPACKSLLLVGRYRPSLRRAREELPSACDVDSSNHLDSLQSAAVVILATSAAEPVLFARHVQPGASVFDVTEPCNVSGDCLAAAQAGSFRVFRSGLVRAGSVDLGRIDSTLPQGSVYACLAEALLFALEDRFDADSVGAPDLDLMTSLMDAARRWSIVPRLELRSGDGGTPAS